MTRRHTGLAAGVLLAASACSFAQGPGGPGFGPGRGPGGFGGRGGQVVTGEPFTAQSTSTSLEKLADGTTIAHTSTTLEARDAQGRTLRTVTGTGGAATTPSTRSTLLDPVAHTLTTWDAQSKVAISMALPEPRGNGWGPKPVADHPPAFGGRTHAVVTQQTLSPKTIAGVYATGTKTTVTIPAGAEGNDKPLVSTREIWTSPDLKIVLLEISESPRDGEHKVEVTSLSTAGPDATLFQVPAGYTVKEQTRHRGM